jgi:mRNA interferase HicA
MKRLDLVRRLEEEGCVLLRHGSRHDIYHNPMTGHSEPLPRHREINECSPSAFSLDYAQHEMIKCEQFGGGDEIPPPHRRRSNRVSSDCTT